MAVDFRSLLNVSSDDVERPKPLPNGHYIGTVASFEFGLSKQKQTPYCRLNLVPLQATDDVDMTRLEGVNLADKSLRKDYFITPKARYRLADMLDAVLGKDSRILDQRIGDVRGAKVMFGVTERQSEDGADTFNDVTTVVAAPQAA